MANTPLLFTRPEDSQREACPVHFGFYHCGDFDGCCAADPCGFLDFTDPCDAAVANPENQDSNNGDDGDGDDDGDDGSDGGDEDITTTTARSTSTRASPPSSTKSTKTTSTADVSETETTSAVETRHTSSTTNPPFTSSVEAPTAIVNSTNLATSTSTNTISGSVTETLPPAPSEESSNNYGTAPPLSKTTVAGVSVGAVIGGIALLLLLFWLLRRRRLSKRMSSLRGDSPGPNRPPDEKSTTMDPRHSLTGTALGSHLVPEIRVQPPNPNHYNSYTHSEQTLPTGPRPDAGWPLHSASDPNLHQQYSSQQQPVYAELDSHTPPPGPWSPNRRPSPQTHPSQLTPGFPGTQMAIQTRGGSRGTDVDVRGYAGYAGEPPRATLNATDDERLNNLYANSWARGL